MTEDHLIVICGYGFLIVFISVVLIVTGLPRKWAAFVGKTLNTPKPKKRKKKRH